MLELRELALEDEAAFTAFSERYRREAVGERLSMRLNPEGLPFAQFHGLLRSLERPECAPADTGPNRNFMIWKDGAIVGAMSLRWQDTDFVLRHAGHIGYCVVPWARGKGVASRALGLMLPVARKMGMKRVLLTCAPENAASRRVILKNGGAFERSDAQREFYWVDTGCNVRPAEPEDVGRLAEIEVFNYRLNFYPIFRDDDFYFRELTVENLEARYAAHPEWIGNTFVYDDGVVKGFVRLDGAQIVKLFVEPALQGRGIGGALLGEALARGGAWLWALEKNARAIRFYEKHSFALTQERKPEEDTEEYLVKMQRR